MTSGDRYVGQPVVVIGAAGFIGRWVARALHMENAELVLLVRDVQAARPVLDRLGVRATLVACDLERPDELDSLIDRIRPMIVFNLAGYGVDPLERNESVAERINAGLVEQLAHAVASYDVPRWTGQRIVHAGSALEYGIASGNLSEDSPAHPTTVYGRTKLAGSLALQAVCRSRAIRGLTARLFTVYGAGEHSPRLLPTLLGARGHKTPIDLTDGRQERDFTYVEDVAEGLLRLGVSPAPPGAIVNLATGRLTSVRVFIETATETLGIDKQRLRFGAIPTRSEEMHHDPVTIERLEGLTAWRPSTLIRDGIGRTATWCDALLTPGRIGDEIRI
jgi:nucleoside-diphosphate-sugar epimerase